MLDLALWLVRQGEARLQRGALVRRPGLDVEHNASAGLRFNDIPVQLEVSWDSPRPLTEISLAVHGANGEPCCENIGGTFTHFRTRLNEKVLMEEDVTLRENTRHRSWRRWIVGPRRRLIRVSTS